MYHVSRFIARHVDNDPLHINEDDVTIRYRHITIPHTATPWTSCVDDGSDRRQRPPLHINEGRCYLPILRDIGPPWPRIQ
jgi:hypothetical protein